jgi:hypothetical protein
VHALDDHHVAFADWPGNNRIESLRNLERDDRIGMLFLFPGLEIFMRINGRARATTDDALLARFAEGGRRRPSSSPSTKSCITAGKRSTVPVCGGPSAISTGPRCPRRDRWSRR